MGTTEWSCAGGKVRDWALLLGLLLAVIWANATQIGLKAATDGWSPIFWVFAQLHPSQFVNDFPSGIAVYDRSLPMHVYLLASKYLGIQPEVLLPIMVGAEIVLVGIGSVYLSRALLPQAPPIASILFAALVVASSVRTMDLARFASPHEFIGLYYGIADACRIVGVALIVRGRVLLASFALAIAVMSHPIWGGLAAVFGFCFLVIGRPAAFRTWPVWAGAATFVVLVGSWFVYQFGATEMASGSIPAERWVALTRAFSYHWYPVDIGVFTHFHWAHSTPFVSFCLLLAHYIVRVSLASSTVRALAVGFIVMGCIAAVGVLNASVLLIPALIKVALHRAAELIILVGLPIVAWGLLKDALTAAVWVRAIALLICVSPFLDRPGLPLLLSVLLVAGKWFEEWRCSDRLPRVLEAVIATGALTLPVVYFLGGWGGDWKFTHYFGSPTVYWVGTIALVAQIAMMRFLKSTGALAATVAVLAVCVGIFLTEFRLPEARVRFAQSFRDAQLWAKENTPRNAVFLLDPTIYYGWRDYSERSSFGNLREWAHTSWAYDSQGSNYREGMRRLGEFDLTIDPYLNLKPSIAGFDAAHRELMTRFYKMPDSGLAEIARRNNLDFIVIVRKNEAQTRLFTILFKNEHFVIYRVPEKSP